MSEKCQSPKIPATAFHYRNIQNKPSTLLKAIKIISERNSKFNNSLQILQSKHFEPKIQSSKNYTISFKDFVKNKNPEFQCLICYQNFPINEGFKCSSILNSVNVLKHLICVTCLKGYAHNSCFEGIVGYGGLGLKCVEPDCNNVILLSEFEKYINEEDYLPLQNRLQEQCIIDAGLADLVTCSECGLKSCVDNLLTFFTCNCGRKQCRNCPRIYDEIHEGKICQEMDFRELPTNSFCNLNELGHGRCEECGKTCRNTEIPEELDEIALQEIQNQFNQ
uniref:RING-type domain-containing protein n=1 Tax=Panagrolaimus davidi TaxID=227884 RepID=A0A914PE01_9BILA